MILDLLPLRRNRAADLPGKWGYCRDCPFCAQFRIGLGAVVWSALSIQVQSTVELYWLLVGNVAYYAVGILLAYRLRDNRASVNMFALSLFCKK